MKSALSPDEENVMKMTMKAAFLRAAEIVEKISYSDVLDMQDKLLRNGASLEKVTKVDRAMVAAAHLRTIAEKELK